jgi:hypothetical protein
LNKTILYPKKYILKSCTKSTKVNKMRKRKKEEDKQILIQSKLNSYDKLRERENYTHGK